MNAPLSAASMFLLAGASPAVALGTRAGARNLSGCPLDGLDSSRTEVRECNRGLGSDSCGAMEIEALDFITFSFESALHFRMLRRFLSVPLQGASLAFKDGPSRCVKGDKVTLELQLTVDTSANALHDLSMWVPSEFGSTYGDPFEGARCAVTLFPCREGRDGTVRDDLLGRVADFELRAHGIADRRLVKDQGNAASDGSRTFESHHTMMSTGYVAYDAVKLTIPCRGDDDGQLAVPVCLSWGDDAEDRPRSSHNPPREKCRCDVSSIPEVAVSFAHSEGDRSPAEVATVAAGGETVGECTPNGGKCDDLLDVTCCNVCVEEVTGSGRFVCSDRGSLGGSHLAGFRGQEFDFAGADGGYYALFAQEDPVALVTIRLHAPVPGLDPITYIVGFAVKSIDLNGELHTVQAFVENPKDLYAHHHCPDKDEPCLAEGALTVLLDGEVVTRPGTYELGPGFEVGAVNLPGECRSFDFEEYWGRKVREAKEAATLGSGAGDGRRLESWAVPIEEWVLGDVMVTNRAECEDYVKRGVREDSLFDFQAEYVSFQISTPALTVRVNHGKVHQLAIHDPENHFDLPDHRTFQQNIAFGRAVLGSHPRGILGETVRPTRDSSGSPITHGNDAMRGEEEDYRVSGPFMDDFVMGCDGSLRVVASTEVVGSL